MRVIKNVCVCIPTCSTVQSGKLRSCSLLKPIKFQHCLNADFLKLTAPFHPTCPAKPGLIDSFKLSSLPTCLLRHSIVDRLGQSPKYMARLLTSTNYKMNRSCWLIFSLPFAKHIFSYVEYNTQMFMDIVVDEITRG